MSAAAGELAALRGVARRLSTIEHPVEVRTAHAWGSVIATAARNLGRTVEHLRAEVAAELPQVEPDSGYEGLTLDEAAARYASRVVALAVEGAPAARVLDERRAFTAAAHALSGAVRSTRARGVAATSPDTDGPGVAARGARATSRAAAEQLSKSGTNRRRVLDAVVAVARDPQVLGLTDLQIATATGMRDNSVRPRRGELVEGGWLMAAVDDEGRPMTREHYGREHTVWVLTRRAEQTADLWATHPGA